MPNDIWNVSSDSIDNPWDGIDDNGISIAQEIASIIARHGRQGYLRKKTEQKCRCLSPITGEADVDCPTCSSTGYVYLDHRIRLFRHVVTRAMSGAHRKDMSPFGVLAVDEAVVYVQHDNLFPSIHDWVIEVITDEKGDIKPPPLIERIYDIAEIYDLREDYGQVAYYALRCRKIEIGK